MPYGTLPSKAVSEVVNVTAWPILLASISEAFVLIVIHHSLEVAFKSVLLCYYFSPLVTCLQTWPYEWSESQVVYIVNGKATDLSEVNQNEEQVLMKKVK